MAGILVVCAFYELVDQGRVTALFDGIDWTRSKLETVLLVLWGLCLPFLNKVLCGHFGLFGRRVFAGLIEKSNRAGRKDVRVKNRLLFNYFFPGLLPQVGGRPE